MMRAIVQDTYGEAEVLHEAEIDRPEPGAKEVLIKVHAAGLDRGTWHLMTGKPYLARLAIGFRAPRNPVPGFDVAGTVVEVGSEVTRFSVGDEVFGAGKGTFAEYAVAREKQAGPQAGATSPSSRLRWCRSRHRQRSRRCSTRVVSRPGRRC